MNLSSFPLRLLLACIVFSLPATLLGQYYTFYDYAFGRHTGGDLALRIIMVEDSIEVVHRTYTANEIMDFNPEISLRRVLPGLQATIYGMDTAGIWQFYELDLSSGQIMHQRVPQTVVPRITLAGGNDTIYMIGLPPGGGNDRLVKLSMSTGNEFVIGNFSPGQFSSVEPSSAFASFHTGKIFLSAVDSAGTSRIYGIDMWTAQVQMAFSTTAYPILSMDIEDAGIYPSAWVLTQPYGQSYHELHRIDLLTGNDQVMNTIAAAHMHSFYPQTFYLSDIDFGVTTVDSLGHELIQTFYLFSQNGSAPRYQFDPGAYDAKVLIPNGNFYVGAREPQSPTLDVYPNPVSQALQLQGIRQGSAYQLRDVAGHTVRSGTWDGQPLSVAGLPAGAYLLRVRDDAGVRSARIVKQ